MERSWAERPPTAWVTALAVSTPSFAQGFDAEIDCGGLFVAGDIVPFAVRLEEQALVSHDVQLLVTMSIPNQPDQILIDRLIVLGANQDRKLRRQVILPVGSPAGQYVLSLDADDGVDVAVDTCSFNVQ